MILIMEKKFYDRKETGIGECFWDSLIADIESLIIQLTQRS